MEGALHSLNETHYRCPSTEHDNGNIIFQAGLCACSLSQTGDCFFFFSQRDSLLVFLINSILLRLQSKFQAKSALLEIQFSVIISNMIKQQSFLRAFNNCASNEVVTVFRVTKGPHTPPRLKPTANCLYPTTLLPLVWPVQQKSSIERSALTAAN